MNHKHSIQNFPQLDLFGESFETSISDEVVSFWSQSEGVNEFNSSDIRKALLAIINDSEEKPRYQSEVSHLKRLVGHPDAEYTELTNTQDRSYAKKERMSALMKLFQTTLKNKRWPLKFMSAMLQQLNIVIDFGNFHRLWDECFFPSFNLIYREENPIANHGNWEKRLAMETLVESYYLDLKSVDTAALCNQHWQARLQLSLILDSFILNRSIQEKVLNQAIHPALWLFHGNRLYVNIEIDPKNPSRRIFLSDITAFLLYRMAENNCFPSNKITFDFSKLAAYAKYLGFQQNHKIRYLTNWIEAIELILLETTPRMFIEYSKNKLKSYSLKPIALSRLFHLESNETEPPQIRTSDIKPSKHLSQTLSAIIKPFKVRSDKNTKKVFEKLWDEIDKLELQLNRNDNYWVLFKWAKHQLPPKHTNVYEPSPNAIKRGLQAIGSKLISMTQGQLITELSSSERVYIYTLVVEQAESDEHYETLRRHLFRFESWLADYYGLLNIDDEDGLFDNLQGNHYSVNANIVTIDEYLNTLEALEAYSLKNGQTSDELTSIMRCILILGYRCGLRRSEAVQLKLNDFSFCETEPKIYIRVSDGRELKTNNAGRILNLTKLMPEDEWQRLNAWYHARVKRLNKDKIKTSDYDSYYFFDTTTQSNNHVDKNIITFPIINLLHQVTGDKSLKYHQFRHSFASLNFLSASAAELNLNFDHYFDDAPETQAWLSSSLTRKYQHIPSNNHSKKYPYWIHRNMGHAGFEMTLHHYIHIMDLIVAELQTRRENTAFDGKKLMSQEMLSALSGISINTLKKQASTKQYIHKKLKRKLGIQDKKPATKPATKFEVASLFKNIPEPLLVAEIFQLSLSGIQQAEMEMITQLPAKKIQAILKLYEDHPAFNRVPLSENEKSSIKILLEKIETLAPGLLTSQKCPHQFNEILAGIVSFESCYVPIKSTAKKYAQHNLKASGILICNNVTDAKNILYLAKKLNFEFSIAHRYGMPDTGREQKRQMKYWKEALKVKKKFATQLDSQNRIGQYGRIEITITNTGNTSKASEFYSAVALILLTLKLHGVLS